MVQTVFTCNFIQSSVTVVQSLSNLSTCTLQWLEQRQSLNVSLKGWKYMESFIHWQYGEHLRPRFYRNIYLTDILNLKIVLQLTHLPIIRQLAVAFELCNIGHGWLCLCVSNVHKGQCVNIMIKLRVKNLHKIGVLRQQSLAY